MQPLTQPSIPYQLDIMQFLLHLLTHQNHLWTTHKILFQTLAIFKNHPKPQILIPIQSKPRVLTHKCNNTLDQIPDFDQADSIFSMRPLWLPLKSSALRWTWVEGAGPFITNGEMRDNHPTSSETESSSATRTMFNLNKLNNYRPEVVRGDAWSRGQIPESLDSLIESLIQRVDRGRFRFKIGSSSNGPQLLRP